MFFFVYRLNQQSLKGRKKKMIFSVHASVKFLCPFINAKWKDFYATQRWELTFLCPYLSGRDKAFCANWQRSTFSHQLKWVFLMVWTKRGRQRPHYRSSGGAKSESTRTSSTADQLLKGKRKNSFVGKKSHKLYFASEKERICRKLQLWKK